jgi:spore germination protein (amino acid permease)
MSAKGKISSFQFGCLCFSYLSGFSTLFLQSAKLLRQDVWIANLLAVSLAILVVWLMKFVQIQHPDKSMTEIFELLLGKWLGKAIIIMYFIDAVGLTVLTLRALALFYTTAILPNTPIELIMLSLVLITTYAVYLGLETVARTAQLILPLFIISITVIFVLTLRNVDTNPFLPLFQSRLSEIVYGTLLSFSLPFGKMIGLVFFFHRVSNLNKLMLSSTVGLVLSFVYLLTATYLTFGSLGMNLTQSAAFPFFTSIQLVRIGLYLERIEIIIIGIWTIFTLYETIVAHCMFIQIFGDLFRIKDMKPFILPIGLLVFAVALNSYIRPTELPWYNYTILPFSIVPPALLLPLVFALLTFIKKRISHPQPAGER